MNFNRYFALVALLSASIFLPRISHAQTDFGQRIWWKADHNSLSAEVNRVIGIPSATYPASGTPNVNGAHFTNAAGQWPVANQKTNLPFPGKSAPIDVVAKVKPSSAAAAIGRYLRKVGPVANAVALVTLAAELGYTLSDGPTGPQLVAPPHPSALEGKEYREGFTGEWSSSIVPACQKAAAELYTSWVQTSTFHEWNGGSNCVLRRVNTASGAVDFINHAVNQRPREGPVPTGTSAELQALEDAIASKSGWPSSSDISTALADAVKSGEVVDYDPASVSGPASRPGTSSTTTSPDGTATTVNVTHNYTYNGPKVTVTTTTTTTTTAPGGSPVTSIKTDTDPAPEADPEEAGTPTDTPLPGQPKLYEPKYPDGLVGVWNSKKAQLDSTPLLNLLDDLMPQVASSGSCPSWIISMDLDAWNFGAHDVSPPCWLWDFARVVIIASALLLARRLVFGG